MFKRLRQSLALWLVVQYALVFAASATILFGVLYWVLARALEERDQAIVERRAAVLARAYADGQLGGVVERFSSGAVPDGDAWFVRVIDPRDGPIWVKAPPDWVQTVVQRIPIPEWGVTAERAIPTVRLPQDALRDYAIASRALFDGRLIQVGRSADSRAVPACAVAARLWNRWRLRASSLRSRRHAAGVARNASVTRSLRNSPPDP